jgi:hypothetical protein
VEVLEGFFHVHDGEFELGGGGKDGGGCEEEGGKSAADHKGGEIWREVKEGAK